MAGATGVLAHASSTDGSLSACPRPLQTLLIRRSLRSVPRLLRSVAALFRSTGLYGASVGNPSVAALGVQLGGRAPTMARPAPLLPWPPSHLPEKGPRVVSVFSSPSEP